MKNTEEIRIQAQLLTGLQIDPVTCYELVSKQLPNIAREYFRAGKYVRERFETSQKHEEYELKREAVRVDRLVYVEQQTSTNSYELYDNTLLVYNPASYEIRYYSVPDIPETRTTEIKMPPAFVSALKFFVAARVRARLFGQADSNAVSFYEEYVKELQEADSSVARIDSRNRRMPPSRRSV